MDALTERERYQRLKDHFQACAELPVKESRDYVDRLLLTDPDLGKELGKLLQYHQTPTPAAFPGPSKPAAGTKVRRRRKAPSFTALMLLTGIVGFLAILGTRFWTLNRLEAHLRTEKGRELRGSLDYRVSELRNWATRQKEMAQSVLEDPELVTEISALLGLAKDPEDLKRRLLESPSYRKVSERMLRVAPELGGRGFVVISPSGLDLCAESPDIVGRSVSQAGAAYVRRVLLGEWIVSRPYPDRMYALGVSPDYQNPVMFVSGPIRDHGGGIIAMGVFRFSPKRFYEFLAPTTVEFLAFDEKAMLLNDVGELEGLKRTGLLTEDSRMAAPFRVHLRDPGVSLDSDKPPEPRSESWPPTLMARSAVQGSDGVDDSGHRDFRGRPVLAAWSWLPEWEMGVGAQVPLERVLASSRSIRAVFDGLLLVIAAGALGLLGLSRYLRVGLRSGQPGLFGAYVLERRIGKGGMAEVFLAHHSYLKRPGAVKILNTPKPDPASIERFEREARLTSRLGHPNTIQIFDYGETPEGKLYYVMEYVAGLTLAQLLSLESSLPVARVVYLLKQIAGALEEAHQLGLYHRDLKSSNVMLCSKGGLADLVKVLDFGIACCVTGEEEDITKSTDLLGTPAFIAPERLRAPQKVDPRSDIYSFGAVAFHLLTGRNVFEGPGPAELIYQVMAAERPSPSRIRGEQIPEALEDLVLRCLSIDPEARPADFREIERILRGVEDPESWNQETARLWWASNQLKVEEFMELTS